TTMTEVAVAVELDRILSTIRGFRHIAVGECTTVAHHHAVWKLLTRVAQKSPSTLAPEPHKLSFGVCSGHQCVANDAARNKDAIIRGCVQELVWELIIVMYRAASPITVGDEIVGRINEVEAVCKNKLHHATFAKDFA